MKPAIPLFVAFALLPLAGVSRAGNATIQTQMGPIPGFAADCIGILVSDTDGDGFSGVDGADAPTGNLAGLTISPGEIFGGDDFVIDVLTPLDLGGGTFGVTGAGNYINAILQSEQLLAIYWFYNLGSGETVAVGQAFGMFRTDTADPNSGATHPFEWPNDGADERLAAFASSLAPGSPYTTAQFIANDGVVSAPSGDGDGDGLPDDWEDTNLGTRSEGAGGDREKDGLTNIEEFLFGSHPAFVTGSSHRPRVSIDAGGQLLYEVRINKDAASVDWIVETSSDGTTWTDATGLFTPNTDIDLGDGTELKGFFFDDPQLEPPTPIRLLRVRIN